jgi:hypothetical protein
MAKDYNKICANKTEDENKKRTLPERCHYYLTKIIERCNE